MDGGANGCAGPEAGVLERPRSAGAATPLREGYDTAAAVRSGTEEEAQEEAILNKKAEIRELFRELFAQRRRCGRLSKPDQLRRRALTAELDELTEQLGRIRTSPDQLVAFAMGTHSRLGADNEERVCAVKILGGCSDVLRCIAAHVRAI